MSEAQSVRVDALFEVLESPPLPEWPVRVTLRFERLMQRGSSLRAKVGAQALEGVSRVAGQPQIVGFLRRVPQRGDEIVLKDGPVERRTGIRYQQGAAAAVASLDGDEHDSVPVEDDHTVAQSFSDDDDERAYALELRRTSYAYTITAEQQRALTALAAFTPAATQATIPNALGALRAVGAFYGVPWQVGYVTLEHEGGIRLIRHNDGVMQTTRGARTAAIRAMPRELKLALLELAQTDTTADHDLEARLETAFHAPRLAVQIACGMTELKTNLDLFNGYVALAWIAYNAGPGWAYSLATRGHGKVRPHGISASAWEDACKGGATLAHQAPSAMRIDDGLWQCDRNMPGWFKAFFVKDRPSGLTVVAYQYLRSIRACIRADRPTTACDASTHGHREPGTGALQCNNTRDGVLDKLYAPATKLGRAYRSAATDFPHLVDNGQPLKVSGGTLVAVAPAAQPSAPSPTVTHGLYGYDDRPDTDASYARSQRDEESDDGVSAYALETPCSVNGARATCGTCTATERRVSGAPGHLVRVPSAHVYGGAAHDQLTDAASAAFVRMREAAIASGAIAATDDWLKLVSGYRDYASQSGIWKRRLEALYASFGCSNWSSLAPVVDATSAALASTPPPHGLNLWLSRFRSELARVHVAPANCDPAQMRNAAASANVELPRGTLDPIDAAVIIGRKTVAPPGASPHHTGRAIDMMMGHAPHFGIVSSHRDNVAWQHARPWYGWLVCNASRFGFFPYNVEPWHWEYNPPDA